MSYNKRTKSTDEQEIIPLQLDKTAVLQQAKEFNKTSVRVNFLRLVLINLLRLLNNNCEFSELESTETFFSLTRLIQNKDENIRQLVLLVMKELIKLGAKDVIIITSSLIKDTQPSELVFRANAIRTLTKILDMGMLQSIERTLKNCIVEKKDTSIKTASLSSSYLLYNECSDIIKRWTNEINDALVNTKKEQTTSFIPSFFGANKNDKENIPYSTIFQYHALGLIYKIKKDDKMAVLKLVLNLVQRNENNSNAIEYNNVYAYCLAIRIAFNYINTNHNNFNYFYEKLSSLLRHSSDAVNFEAAKAIISLKNTTKEQVYPAVKTLQQFFGSTKTVYRLAALKQITLVASRFPNHINNWNIGLDDLIDDNNKSIAINAITTLLISKNDSKINVLVKKVEDVINDIQDEDKIVVVEAVRKLVIDNTSTNKTLDWVDFIGSMLRYDGGFIFKEKVVNTLIDLDKNTKNKNVTEKILGHLCEFIEDCEFPKLTIEIVYYIGSVGPKTDNPSLYIRFIYNRIVLETSHVRAVAVSALSKFCIVEDYKMTKSIEILLTSCLNDQNDEVRNRAIIGLQAIKEQKTRELLFIDDQICNLDALEESLTDYLNDESGLNSAFNFDNVAKVSINYELFKNHSNTQENVDNPDQNIDHPTNELEDQKNIDNIQDPLQQLIDKEPTVSTFGKPVNTNPKTIELTENDHEYPVCLRKFVFDKHIIFQFLCRNTINDCRLENIKIEPELDQEETVDIFEKEESKLSLIKISTIAKLDYNEVDSIIAIYQFDTLSQSTVSSNVSFTVKEFDQSTKSFESTGFEEDFNTSEFKLLIGDYIETNNSDYENIWNSVTDSELSLSETFILEEIKTINKGIEYVNEIFNLNEISSANKSLHSLKFCGTLFSYKFAVHLRMAIIAQKKDEGLNLEINVRAESEKVAQALVNAIE